MFIPRIRAYIDHIKKLPLRSVITYAKITNVYVTFALAIIEKKFLI